MHYLAVLTVVSPQLFVMPKFDCQTRMKIILLRTQGYSVQEIKNWLEEESTFVSRQALYKLVRKFQTHQTFVDLSRGAPTKTITTEMLCIMEQELSKNDELTATQLLSVLKESYPTLSVSLATVKRERQCLGWVCTMPHYCQLIQEVSTDAFYVYILTPHMVYKACRTINFAKRNQDL